MKPALLFFLPFILLNCHKQATTQKKEIPREEIPLCIREKIEQIKNEPVRNPPRSCWEYHYQGKTVYFFPAYCCDVMSEVYDTNCRILCHPDGGFTGKGDGRCTDFSESRGNGKRIWQDERQAQ